jgi:hypothetical protein
MEYEKRPPDLPPPEYIHLPDGRSVATQALLNQVRNRRNIHRNPAVREQIEAVTWFVRQPAERIANPRNQKYTVEDRVWQAGATFDQIAERYGLEITQARQIKYQAQARLRVLAEKQQS